MQFLIHSHALAQAASWVVRALPARTPVPILGGVKIDVSADQVTFLTFDYETSARVTLGAEDVSVQGPGQVVVSARMLSDIAAALAPGEVKVTLDGTKVRITSGASKFALHTMPVEDYPNAPAVPDRGGQIDTASFSSAVSQAVLAASKDDSVPLLTGAQLVIEGDDVKVLATDRYRLARVHRTWSPDTADASISVLVRAKVLADVARMVPSAGAMSVTVSDDLQLVGFSAQGLQVTTLVIQGDYPVVERLFPDTSRTAVTVDAAALLDAVRRVSLVAERGDPVRLAFSREQVEVAAGAARNAGATATEILPAELNGPEAVVYFNPQYLADGIGSLRAPTVRISLTLPTKPVLFVGLDDNGEPLGTCDHLLVPIRAAA